MRLAMAAATASAVLLLGCASISRGASEVKPKVPQRHEGRLLISFPIEGQFGLPVEPSGLTFYDGFLYTVSDEHDASIFKLIMTVDTHVAQADLKLVQIPLEFPAGTELAGADFEGIAADGQGGFYILSEQYACVFHMSLGDPTLQPVGEPLLSAGEEQGLFAAKSAGLEGIAVDGSKLLLCAERQPRAVVEFDPTSKGASALRVHKDIRTGSEFPEGTDKDFAALFAEGGALYVLERNAYAVCKLEKVNGEYRAVATVFYGKIIDEHDLRYQRKQREAVNYGRGEGLAMDAERIYIMLDNNGRPLKADPSDTRARLIVLKRPTGF